ncbi:MAG: TrbG/VirB9 family P-type conjugative transfer protein [Vicinamibacterales bacterium]
MNHRKFFGAWLACVLTVLPAAAFAVMTATPLPGDARLVQFEYEADNTFLVLARPKSVTHVEFAPDEQIQTVAGGDTKHWELSPTANRRHLFIKPIYEQMETSMTVITDKRSYQFVLRSTGPGAKWYQRVTWRYGQTMLMDLRAEEDRSAERASRERRERDVAAAAPAGAAIENLKFGYTIEGNAAFRPTAVFSDGKVTWIRIPEVAELPALFAVTEDGTAAVVNYIIRGEYMVAQQVVERGVLKLGRQEVKFTRTSKGSGWSVFGPSHTPERREAP